MFTKNLMMTLAIALAALSGIASSTTVAADGESNTLITNSYQQYSLVGCPSVVACYASFPATTATTTVITAVSCSFFVTQGSEPIVTMGTTHNQPQFALQPFYIATTGQLNFGVNATTKLFVTQGDTVYTQVYAVEGTNQQQMNCNISGYHS